METHGDDLVTCPYCLPPKTHQLKYKSLGTHLDRIRKSDPDIRKKIVCKFNSMHLLDVHEVDHHHTTCPDRRDDVMSGDYGGGAASDEYDTAEMDLSPPRQGNVAVFRLNPNNHGLAGGYHSKVKATKRSEVQEAPRLPIGMAPRLPIGMAPRLPVGMAPPSPKPASKRAKKRAVTQCMAFNKGHLD